MVSADGLVSVMDSVTLPRLASGSQAQQQAPWYSTSCGARPARRRTTAGTRQGQPRLGAGTVTAPMRPGRSPTVAASAQCIDRQCRGPVNRGGWRDRHGDRRRARAQRCTRAARRRQRAHDAIAAGHLPPGTEATTATAGPIRRKQVPDPGTGDTAPPAAASEPAGDNFAPPWSTSKTTRPTPRCCAASWPGAPGCARWSPPTVRPAWPWCTGCVPI